MAPPTTHPVFHPTAQLDAAPPDLVLTSANRVVFHVHHCCLLAASTNHFAFLLDPPVEAIVALPESSQLISVMLHAIYNRPIGSPRPTSAVLIASLDTLKKYGIPLDRYVCANTPLFTALATLAQSRAIELYTLAAENDLYDLAAAASSYLISYNLSSITDEIAVRMGSLYLKKLFVLHSRRTKVVRGLLLTPPATHAPTRTCGADNQLRLLRHWDLATASLQTRACPSTSVGSLRSIISIIEPLLTCRDCKATLNARVRQMVVEWEETPRTI
ncbi:unnamed protein product [Somion occarium]|uniref:BTB domain-containing protein n=1 Tax=Somion occarium TaxID=3059160 RepID=A0ABP1E1P2_9APHY